MKGQWDVDVCCNMYLSGLDLCCGDARRASLQEDTTMIIYVNSSSRAEEGVHE